jgi:tetratricopeptide (TPR) repeat protein
VALLLAARGEADAARAHFRDAIALGGRLLELQAGDPAFSNQHAESQANFGMLLDQIGDRRGAEHLLRAAIDVLRGLAENYSGEPKYSRNLAIACNNLSYLLRQSDRTAAESLVREAVARLEKLSLEHADTIAHQDDLALCYNNLAALHAQWEQLDDAIASYQRAISLQEQLARKAPAVIRHRSDLATSLSNLGVAYCRADRATDADAAFGRARELLATLADDYPDEIAFRSSFAALLNNQALALAKAGRHEDALSIYSQAIESQRMCHERWTGSPLMREVLGKMYYNYGQSLQATGRHEEAIDTALARRDLWQGNGERLVSVAAELADLRGNLRGSPDAGDLAALQRRCDEKIVATLWQAYEAGWPHKTKLAADERFAYLRGNPQFMALVAKLNVPAAAPSAGQVGAKGFSSGSGQFGR